MQLAQQNLACAQAQTSPSSRPRLLPRVAGPPTHPLEATFLPLLQQHPQGQTAPSTLPSWDRQENQRNKPCCCSGIWNSTGQRGLCQCLPPRSRAAWPEEQGCVWGCHSCFVTVLFAYRKHITYPSLLQLHTGSGGTHRAAQAPGAHTH